MNRVASAKLPRDTTRQGEGLLYGPLSRTVNRWAGLIIIAFLAIHVVGNAIVHVGVLGPFLSLMPGLAGVQFQPWFHAVYVVIFPAIAFHFLYALKLIAMDLGLRIGYRWSFWVIVGVAAMAALGGVIYDVPSV